MLAALALVGVVARASHGGGSVAPTVGGAAAGVIGVYWLVGYRRRHFWWPLIPVEGALLGVAAVSSVYGAGMGLAFSGVLFRSLFGSHRQTALLAAAYAGAAALAGVYAGHAPAQRLLSPEALAALPNLVILAAVMRMLVASITRQEAASRRERALREVAERLVAAESEAEIAMITNVGVGNIMPTAREVRLELSEESVNSHAGGHVIRFPAGAAIEGAIVIVGSGPPAADERAALATLASHVALALDRRRSYEKLERQAFHDALTDLPNRTMFARRLEDALERRARADERVSVIFIDLDDFKLINDGMGHDAGDALLRAVGSRLAAMLRGTDTVARLGGDEFAVIVQGDDGPQAVATRIGESFAEPFVIFGVPVRVSASVGVAGPEVDGDQLLRSADTAMYAAKRGGKGRTAHYDDSLAPLAPDATPTVPSGGTQALG
jgi:diguanylate cyclase (GGDEF)-like protein